MFSVVETFAWRRIVCTVLGSACVRINSVAHRCRSECTVTCGKPLRSVSLSSHSLIVLGFSGVPSYCDTQNCVNGANRFVILTTTPNASMHGIHDRMPLILRRDQIRPWLTDAESALHLLAAPPPLLERHSTDGQMSFGDLL